MGKKLIIGAIVALVLISSGIFAFFQLAGGQGGESAAEQEAATDEPAATTEEADDDDAAADTEAGDDAETDEDEAATADDDPASIFASEGAIIVDGRVVPRRSMELYAGTDTIVTDLLVEEGDTVEAGKVLVRQDTEQLELRLEGARLGIEEAQLAIATNEAMFEEQIQQARNQVNRAQNQFRQVEGSITQRDIDAARADLEQARARLATLQSAPDEDDVRLAQENLRQARQSLVLERDALSVAKTSAETQMQIAANTLRSAQDNYSQVYWANQSKAELSQDDKDSEQAALRAVEDAQAQLEMAENQYELSQQAEITGLELAQSNVRNAEIELEQLLEGATEEELVAARAQVVRAENNLQKLVGEQRALELQAAQAAVSEAQGNLQTALERVNDPTFIAGSEMQVQRAEFALKQAELELEQATLEAPMDGTIAQVNVAEGDLPPLTQPVIILADFEHWQVETGDLTELDVTRIEVGDPAVITFDALPGFEMPGTVTSIGNIGANQDGAITYNVTITPDRWDERLRWNMTASVRINPSN